MCGLSVTLRGQLCLDWRRRDDIVSEPLWLTTDLLKLLSFTVVQSQVFSLHFLLSSNANRASLTRNSWEHIRPPLVEHSIQLEEQSADFLQTCSWPSLVVFFCCCCLLVAISSTLITAILTKFQLYFIPKLCATNLGYFFTLIPSSRMSLLLFNVRNLNFHGGSFLCQPPVYLLPNFWKYQHYIKCNALFTSKLNLV